MGVASAACELAACPRNRHRSAGQVVGKSAQYVFHFVTLD